MNSDLFLYYLGTWCEENTNHRFGNQTAQHSLAFWHNLGFSTLCSSLVDSILG